MLLRVLSILIIRLFDLVKAMCSPIYPNSPHFHQQQLVLFISVLIRFFSLILCLTAKSVITTTSNSFSSVFLYHCTTPTFHIFSSEGEDHFLIVCDYFLSLRISQNLGVDFGTIPLTNYWNDDRRFVDRLGIFCIAESKLPDGSFFFSLRDVNYTHFVRRPGMDTGSAYPQIRNSKIPDLTGPENTPTSTTRVQRQFYALR
jgi:hypothetical protein